ncbi:hypothetical protein NPIL_456721 [Nephila pilipes]|uniref:Uncharacterized protein n=1 Tax=Nephila pilipes TaxID=299642 RepID=A0A8X6UK72_NEPPI|nr:hypothetical protein NPIL_456721 [Nephila pilipes]
MSYGMRYGFTTRLGLPSGLPRNFLRFAMKFCLVCLRLGSLPLCYGFAATAEKLLAGSFWQGVYKVAQMNFACKERFISQCSDMCCAAAARLVFGFSLRAVPGERRKKTLACICLRRQVLKNK